MLKSGKSKLRQGHCAMNGNSDTLLLGGATTLYNTLTLSATVEDPAMALRVKIFYTQHGTCHFPQTAMPAQLQGSSGPLHRWSQPQKIRWAPGINSCLLAPGATLLRTARDPEPLGLNDGLTQQRVLSSDAKGSPVAAAALKGI